MQNIIFIIEIAVFTELKDVLGFFQINKNSKNLLGLSSNAESIAQLAKFQFNKSKSFSPHDANPVYLKNTNYKKISNE